VALRGALPHEDSWRFFCHLTKVGLCLRLCLRGDDGFRQNFGLVRIGESSTATITVPISTAGTVGSISVRLLGAENLDFTNAGGGTCAVATAYTAKATCTVEVNFAPKYAGPRNGAILLFSGASGTGNVLANGPVYGIGSGPQVAYWPEVATEIASLTGAGVPFPYGVAVDDAGDVFAASYTGAEEVEAPAGGGAAIVINPTVDGKSLSAPRGLALDGAGDLFILDSGNLRVVEVPAHGGTPTAISPMLDGVELSSNSNALVVDGAGDLIIADKGNERVVEFAADGGPPIGINPTVEGDRAPIPYGVAANGAGDLFIADSGASTVIEMRRSQAPTLLRPEPRQHRRAHNQHDAGGDH